MCYQFHWTGQGRMRTSCNLYPKVKLLLGQSQMEINRHWFDTAWGTWPARCVFMSLSCSRVMGVFLAVCVRRGPPWECSVGMSDSTSPAGGELNSTQLRGGRYKFQFPFRNNLRAEFINFICQRKRDEQNIGGPISSRKIFLAAITF